jgi:hypothetical protein
MKNEICYRCGLPRYEPWKELTDEEIIGIRMNTEGDILAFARAILRKAQDK